MALCNTSYFARSVQLISTILVQHHISKLTSTHIYIIFHGTIVSSGTRPYHCQGFTITLRHTTLGRVPLDEGSARRRDNTQHPQETDTHVSGGIRARNPHQAAVLARISSSSSVICQTAGPKPLTKRFLHIVRSRASSFNSQYPLLYLSSSSNFLRLLPCLLVTSFCPFIFPSITCFRRQFLVRCDQSS